MSEERDRNSLSDETDIPDENEDGGWGWVIVIVCFFCQFVIEGMVGSYGLLYPELLNYFSASPAIVALPGSLIVGAYLFMGLLSSGLINRFGCRIVAFAGALIAALGFAVSFPAQNIYVFTLSYGIISVTLLAYATCVMPLSEKLKRFSSRIKYAESAKDQKHFKQAEGIGIGILYLPSQLMVNTYFRRKRGIAQGIVCSGSGVGMIAIAPLIEYLLNVYGWRGTVLLCSGVFLQVCILTLLLRPFRRSKDARSETCSIENIENDDVIATNTDNLPKFKITDTEGDKTSIINMKTHLAQEVTKEKESLKIHFQRKLNHESTYSLPLNENGTSVDKDTLFLSMQCVHSQKSAHKKHPDGSYLKIFQRKDIFFSASTSFLTKYESRNFSQTVHEPKLETANDHSSTLLSNSVTKVSSGNGFFAQMCKPSVLKNKGFILLSLGCILAQMAQFIPMVFLGDYGLQIGIQRQKISMLFIIFGITNAFGRLTAGLLANLCRCLSPLLICNFGFGACGISCFLFPLYTSYESLAVFMGSFGFFIGFFAPTQPLITLEYVGLENLTSAYGFVTMVKGPAAVLGPPLAGGLYQLTKNYSYSNVAAGSLFMMTAVLQSFIPCVSKPYLENIDLQEFQIST